MNEISNPQDVVNEGVELQLKSQGVGVVQANDGHVFLFTTEVLEVLLAKSIEAGGKVLLFVKHQPKA
jgi:hypothetical protein